MKKIMVAFLMLFTLTACDMFNYDTMVCHYLVRDISYEIEYKEKEIKTFSIIEIKDLTSFTEKDFETKFKEISKEIKKRDEAKGVSAKITNDSKLLTLTTEIDYEVYDYKKDSLSLFDVQLKKEDFKDIYTLRNALSNHNFTCDEVAQIK